MSITNFESRNMNITLWKLNHIGERLWNLATLTATHAALLGDEGRGIAVVAEETRQMAKRISALVEEAITEDKDVDKDKIISLAKQLQFLALNSAIEVHRIGLRGKPAAVCADEIRDLAYSIICLFDKEEADKAKQIVTPWPVHPLTTVNEGTSYIMLNMGGISVSENLINIVEILVAGYTSMECTSKSIKAHGREIPLIDANEMLGKPRYEQAYVILDTPWAGENNRYAVAAEIPYLFYSPVGKPIAHSADMPLAGYVRECWENENGEPFYFMDWNKLV